MSLSTNGSAFCKKQMMNGAIVKRRFDATHSSSIRKRLRSAKHCSDGFVMRFFTSAGVLQTTLSQWIADNARSLQNAFNRINRATSIAARAVVRPRFSASELRALMHVAVDDRFDKKAARRIAVNVRYLYTQKDEITKANLTIMQHVHRFLIKLHLSPSAVRSLHVEWSKFCSDKQYAMRVNLYENHTSYEFGKWTNLFGSRLFVDENANRKHVRLLVKPKAIVRQLKEFQQNGPDVFNIGQFAQVLIDAVQNTTKSATSGK